MITISKILVPIDFGDAAIRALHFGRMLADRCEASLHLIHVIANSAGDHERENRQRSAACARLESLLDDVDRTARHATTSCLVGTIASEIVHYAVENRVDLIVMGTHGHEPTFQMLTGSVAQSVLESAPCPVLAVKDGHAAAWERSGQGATAIAGRQ